VADALQEEGLMVSATRRLSSGPLAVNNLSGIGRGSNRASE
jgi:hypothetical protein